jgi:hypothetical protein
MRIESLDGLRYRIPRDESRGMRTSVMVYASEALMEHIRKDQSLEQAMNWRRCRESLGRAWRCPTSIRGTDFRSAE